MPEAEKIQHSDYHVLKTIVQPAGQVNKMVMSNKNGAEMKLGDESWIDSEIHREHTLTSHRMNWYVASQSFLLTAFAVGSNDKHFIIENVPWLIPSIGSVISFFSWLALFAAFKSMEKLHNKQRENCEDKEFIEFWYKGRPYIHRLGTLPPLIIPPLFMISWLFILCKVMC